MKLNPFVERTYTTRTKFRLSFVFNRVPGVWWMIGIRWQRAPEPLDGSNSRFFVTYWVLLHRPFPKPWVLDQTYFARQAAEEYAYQKSFVKITGD